MTGDAPSPGQSPGPAAESQHASAAPLALYRRYRPASFAEVKGQDHVTEPLRQALRSGRVNHAYLFSGPRGCGKTSSARILARSLNCEKGPTPDPCGVCASCVALAPAGPGSIDVIEIDAASHGGVDDARDLRERAFYAPVAGRFKIYIIDEAHMVTREGFNALLKLVEEPPPHLKFVFATTEPEKVIPTIRSRTHHYPFRLVPPAVLRELLEEILASEAVSYEPAVLPVVIRAGAGSARDSLSVLDQLIAGSDESGLTYAGAVSLLGYTDDRLLDEVVQAFAAQDGAAVFGAIDRVVEGGHDPRRFAADLLDRLRDLIVLAAVPDAATTGLLDIPADRLDSMRAQAEGFGQAELARAAELINAGLIEMRGATSPRLLLELMCAQVLLPAAGVRESDLRVRLERLERRLESGGPLGAGSLGAGSLGAGSLGARSLGARSLDTPADRDDRPARAAAGSTPEPSRPEPSRPEPSRPEPVPASADSPSEAPATRTGRPAGRGADSRPPERTPAPAGQGPAEWEPAAAATSAEPVTAAPAAAVTAPAPGGGLTDAAQLRERWPDVLEAVRRERKVAWILLTNATVESLIEGVLTVEFAREGDAKGFSNSGHDRLLGEVLQQMFGISPQVRATARPPGGSGGGGGSRGPAGPGPGRSGPASGPEAGSPAPGGARAVAPQASQGTPSGANGATRAREAASSAPRAAESSASAPASAAPASAGPAGAAAEPQSGTGSPAGSWEPVDQPPPSWDDPSEAWDDGPEDEEDSYSMPAPVVSGDLRSGPPGSPGPMGQRGPVRTSGIDLIVRELGGRIVEGLDSSGGPLA